MSDNAKKMGFGSIYLLGINGIIGSGIFLLPNQIYKTAGNQGYLVIFVAALATLLITLCYADMASRTTGDGAAWLYSYNAFGRFPGFEVGLFSWIQGIITISAEVAALLNIMMTLVPAIKNPSVYKITGIVIIICLAGICLLGSGVTSISDNLSSAIKIVILVGFIGLAVWQISKGTAHFATDAIKFQPSSAFNTAFYMYSGFSFLPIAAANMQNPEKNLPKALVSVIVTVGIIYSLVQFAVTRLLGPAIANAKSPLATAFSQVFGQTGFIVIIIGMGISILGVAFSVTFSTPYIAYSLASKHKLLPSFLGKDDKRQVPWLAIIVTAVLSCLLFLSGDYIFLVSCVVLISLIQYIPTALSVMHFQKTKSPGWNVPGGKVIPIIVVLLCVYLATGVSFKVWLLIIVMLVIGTAFYLLDDHKKS